MLRESISVLVVEDELLVRMGIVDDLEEAGFKTVEAGSASDAIRVLETRSDIRVVFTDIEMPGTMDGLALSHYVRHRWPPTIIVISSGKRRPSQMNCRRTSRLSRSRTTPRNWRMCFWASNVSWDKCEMPGDGDPI